MRLKGRERTRTRGQTSKKRERRGQGKKENDPALVGLRRLLASIRDY